MTTATPVLPQTIPERLALAERRDGLVTFIEGDDAQPVRWSELLHDARGTAVALAARGIGPGSHVALLGPTTRDLVTTIAASWLAGATVVVLPLPMRMSSIEEFVDQTRRRILGADAALLVIDAELAPFLEAQPGDPLTLGYHDLRGDPAAYVAPTPDPAALAILQFTSGSTSDPKGVMLPHRTVLANVDAIAAALELDPEVDVAVSWLPLYHDMGLVGILTSALVRGVDLVLAGPQTFMASPARWVGWLSSYGGTITAGPNFSWVLAARSLKRLEGLDLSPLRVALNGAEPVDPATVADLVAAGERHDREVGELQIRGTSVMAGYYRHPEATAAAFDGDWFRTGDLAYLLEGELVLCGRIKDVIIVAGRNVFPEDVERSVAEVDGVRAGNVIAFGVEGRRREGVVVVAEARSADLAAVRSYVHARVRDVTGLAADDVVLVAPGTLPKTSSGKVQRSLCRDRYLGEQLQPA